MSGILNIQINPVLGDKEKNLETVKGFVEKYSDKKPDLVVLPEFFSTGIDDNTMINSPEDENGGIVVKNL